MQVLEQGIPAKAQEAREHTARLCARSLRGQCSSYLEGGGHGLRRGAFAKQLELLANPLLTARHIDCVSEEAVVPPRSANDTRCDWP